MEIRYCGNCKKYTLREACNKCGKETVSKAYKFRFKWLDKGAGASNDSNRDKSISAD